MSTIYDELMSMTNATLFTKALGLLDMNNMFKQQLYDEEFYTLFIPDDKTFGSYLKTQFGSDDVKYATISKQSNGMKILKHLGNYKLTPFSLR